MSRYSFSPQERFAVYTVHGEKCYICNKPLNYAATEIDHVIPEHLGNTPERLAQVLELLGRHSNFQLNSPANWLPSCDRCNRLKGGQVWEPSLLVQLCLQRSADRAVRVAEMVSREVNNREFMRALATLEIMVTTGQLPAEQKQHLKALLAFQQNFREHQLRDEAVVVTRTYGVELVQSQVQLVRTSQALLRRLALERYCYRCAITGPCDPSVLEIAHITPLSRKRVLTGLGMSDVLVLRGDIHRLFDNGFLSIDPGSLSILVSGELRDSPYSELHGRLAYLPSDPHARPDLTLLGKQMKGARTPFIDAS